MILTFTPDCELPSRQAVCRSLSQCCSLEGCDVEMHVHSHTESIVVKLRAQGLLNASQGLAGRGDEVLGMPQVRQLLTLIIVMAGIVLPVQCSLPHLSVGCRWAACQACKATMQCGLSPSASVASDTLFRCAGVLHLHYV